MSEVDVAYKALSLLSRRKPSYGDVRYQELEYELISVEDGVLREYSKTIRRGLGVRVYLDGSIGFASTNLLDEPSVEEAVDQALAAAKAVEAKVKLSVKPVVEAKVRAEFKTDPFKVNPEDKVELALSANRASRINSVKSAVTRIGIQRDRRVTVTLDGCEVEVESFLVGLAHMSVAYEVGRLERVFDSRSSVSGWEFLSERDWTDFTVQISRLAVEAVSAPQPKAGLYQAVVDPDLIGLVIHEAFGHAVEGDLVASGSSILSGRLNETVASEHVTIVDEGVVEGGYFTPYDDEAVEKKPVTLVDKGVLVGFLTNLASASELNVASTGNGRAQDFRSQPIVRQTNLYMKPGDYKLEELLEDVDEGIYLRGAGAGGGQVDTGSGTFTFSVGPSRLIRKGELAGLVRGTVVSGSILETLLGVDAVGSDLTVRTSAFGGCGKDGQMVRVGYGGPHVRVTRISVGGG